MSVYERGVKVVSFEEVCEQEIMPLAVRLSFKEESNESDVGLTLPPKVDGGPFFLGTHGVATHRVRIINIVP